MTYFLEFQNRRFSRHLTDDEVQTVLDDLDDCGLLGVQLPVLHPLEYIVKTDLTWSVWIYLTNGKNPSDEVLRIWRENLVDTGVRFPGGEEE